MRRVVVIGSPGAGKSTFSQQLGRLLELPVIHLDSHFWRPGWVEPLRRDWAAQQLELIQQPGWIMDGYYGGTIDIRYGAADTIIFLDVPRTICLWRTLKRRVVYHSRQRPDMAAKCPESIDWPFIQYIWRYPAAKRPDVWRRLAELPSGKHIVHLDSSKAVKKFLLQLAVSRV
ncbi:MAG: DNA topology modulation protein [Herpetosiphonaceae bacterium]|nr:DNA topology modulation protein [Herpetosiphonaceae bacterium]